MACAVFGVALIALGVTLWRRDRADGARQAADQHAEAGPTPAAWRLAIVASFFLLYVGLEVCYSGWVATYADELHLGSGWGTAFTATFWGGFLVGRLFMTWRGERIETGRVLWTSVIAATAVAVLIAVVGAAPVAVLVGSAAFGAAIAPQFPTMLAHLHRRVPAHRDRHVVVHRGRRRRRAAPAPADRDALRRRRRLGPAVDDRDVVARQRRGALRHGPVGARVRCRGSRGRRRGTGVSEARSATNR